MPAAETHPPARTLLVVRTGASVAELSDAAQSRGTALSKILPTDSVRVNLRIIRVATRLPIARLRSGLVGGMVGKVQVETEGKGLFSGGVVMFAKKQASQGFRSFWKSSEPNRSSQ